MLPDRGRRDTTSAFRLRSGFDCIAFKTQMHVSFAYKPYSVRLGLVAALNLSCALYVAKVIRRCKAGWPRFLLAIPVIVVNCYVPLLFLDETEVVSKALFLLCSFWISNFKLLALCLDRGSLTRRWTFAQFAALYSAPIMPQDQMPGTVISLYNYRFGFQESHPYNKMSLPREIPSVRSECSDWFS